MGKLALGPLLRGLVTLLIGFFVARHMLAEDVARKLYAGDTVELWSGGWSISIKQIVDFMLVAIVPTLLPIAVGVWARIKDRYKILVARLAPLPLTKEEVKQETSTATAAQIVKAVRADESNPIPPP